MFGSFSKLPGGNVRPSRFVILGTDNTVTESGANGQIWGISQPYVRNLALSGRDDGFAGIVGDPAINIFGPGDDRCKLELSGTVAIGDRIKSATGGTGVVATANLDCVGAIAMQAGVSGDVIDVKPMRWDVSS